MSELTTTVMALDFHDSSPVKHACDDYQEIPEDVWGACKAAREGAAYKLYRGIAEGDAAREAWEDAWRDAVMRQPRPVSPSAPSSSHTATDE